MRPSYIVWGKVRKGNQRGKRLGFPTANILLHKNIPEGIYAALVIIKGKIFKAATFVGSAKTFGEEDKKVESYILNFDENIYGKWITIMIYKKVRENKKFNSEKELIGQIKKDVNMIESLFLDKH